jgi:hypothetical protein
MGVKRVGVAGAEGRGWTVGGGSYEEDQEMTDRKL